jgi:hypothetical protein
MMKHKQVLKLVVYTEKDIMNANFKEQLKIITKAMKENRFHIEMINPAKEGK